MFFQQPEKCATRERRDIDSHICSTREAFTFNAHKAMGHQLARSCIIDINTTVIPDK